MRLSSVESVGQGIFFQNDLITVYHAETIYLYSLQSMTNETVLPRLFAVWSCFHFYILKERV